MNRADVFALGIDIGGTGTKLGHVDAEGRVHNPRSFPTDAKGTDPCLFLKRLHEHAGVLLDHKNRHIIGIGVSAHGRIDDERRGPIACQSTPALRGLNLRGWLQKEFDLPVVLNNDLTAHALAEYQYGSGCGAQRFLALAVGTGLGAGVIIHGEPLRFLGGTAGDAGRIILEPGGPEDAYGVKGSAEALCGVPAIERLALQRYGRATTAREVITAAREGRDAIAVEIIQEIGGYLGMVLAILSAIFVPERIALTGGTSTAGTVLQQACQRVFDEMMAVYYRQVADLTGGPHEGVDIVLGETGSMAGVLGAVVELLQSYQSHDGETSSEVETGA
ncbi:MAG: ROK family protein [Chloroflexi bacterium]|nr:ROK family protein [Chloroflexota bacterium]